MKKLDIILTIILLIAYVPLSLWGGSQRWAGDTDILPFIMLACGAIYLMFESIRLKSPFLVMYLGILVGLVTIGPSLILYPEDLEGFFILLIVLGAFGFISSNIALWIQNRRKVSESYNQENRQRLFQIWKLFVGLSIVCFAVTVLGGFDWYSASTRTLPSVSYYISRGYSNRDALLFSTMSANDLADEIRFSIIQTVVSGVVGIVALLVGMIMKKRQHVKIKGA